MKDVFFGIDNAHKGQLLREIEATTLKIKKRTNVLSSIKLDKALAIIEKGKITVVKNDLNGNRSIVEELGENDIFGSYFSFNLDNECEYITKTDTKLIIVENECIINPVNTSEYFTRFVINLFTIATDIITSKNQRIQILTKRTIRDKLLEYFTLNIKNHITKSFTLPFSYTDLADYLSIDRSAMYREIKQLKEDGIIETKGKRITLLYD